MSGLPGSAPSSEDILATGQQRGVDGRANNRQRRRERLEAEALGRLKPAITSRLATGATPITLELAWLESLLPKPEGPQDKRYLSRWLTNFLKEGIQSGTWTVDRLPAVIVKAPRQPSPFRPDRMTASRLMTGVRLRHELHFGAIVRPKNDITPEQQTSYRAAQIILSAMLYGGLVQSRHLDALVESFQTRLQHHDGRIWIDLPDSRNGSSSGSPSTSPPKRWFPDPVTTSLMLRWKLDELQWPSGRGRSLESLLLAYLKRIEVHFSFSGGGRGNSASVTLDGSDTEAVEIPQRSVLKFLVDGAQANLRIRVPPLIAEYAVGRNLAVSLPADSWTRMVTGRKVQCEGEKGTSMSAMDLLTSADDSLSPASADAEPAAPSRGRPTEPLALLRRITGGLTRNKRVVSSAAAKKHLRAILADSGTLPPVIEALVRWSLWYLESRQVGKGTIKVSSVRTYLSAIARRLVEYGVTLTVADLRGQDHCAALMQVYDQIVESVTGSTRDDCIDRLVEFHLFLGLHYETPPILWRGRSVRLERRVHANMVSEVEFQLLLKSIREADWPQRRKDLASLVAICAYRLGLRRQEIIGRELNCLEGHDWVRGIYKSIRPLLWIHATGQASIKTRSSNRRSPLAHLMLPEELDLLGRWADRRKREVGPGLVGTELLFTTAPSGNARLTDDDAFSEIAEALRSITGDRDLTFHNLRHSFVTLLESRLLAEHISQRLSEPDTTSGLPTWSLPASWAVPDRLSGEKLLRRLLLTSNVPRGATYLVSALVGHIDPSETVNSYSHSFDYLLNGYLLSEAPALNISSLSALRGVGDSASRVARLRRRRLDDGPTDEAAEELSIRSVLSTLINRVAAKQGFAPMQSTTALATHQFGQASDRQGARALPSLEELYSLMLSTRTPMNNRLRAELLGQPVDLVIKLIDRARSYSDHGTAIIDPKRARSRAIRKKVVKGKQKRVDSRQRPELTGMARALPKSRSELAQAKQVFQALTQGFLADQYLRTGALEAFRASNRSGSSLEVSDESTADAVVRLLKLTEISTSRLEVHVRSKPLAMSEDDVAATIRSSLGIKNPKVTFEERMRTRIEEATYPRLAIRLMGTRGEQERAMYGWKVGLFYSLVLTGAL